MFDCHFNQPLLLEQKFLPIIIFPILLGNFEIIQILNHHICFKRNLMARFIIFFKVSKKGGKTINDIQKNNAPSNILNYFQK